MAEQDDKAGADAKATKTRAVKTGAAPSPRKRVGVSAKEDEHVSNALRTVYQRAVSEDIPLEMLDLLKKLD
ncbi:NepR family anti-sigma factor [Sphingobium amiense]|uniref:NepR family anti-sigma factor n=1 Tax=Sphingobium amiense TaxID=135719 RepID=UPI00082E7765|nr:NepR family anti-sigma factor [Sphingobium amiense]